MDIERCQACHDIEGGDPTCIRCHIDTDADPLWFFQHGGNPTPVARLRLAR